MWAANSTLSCCHHDRFLGSGSAAILFRAVVAGALAAWDADLFSDGLVAMNTLFLSLSHATFGAVSNMHIFLNDVVFAGFDLARFGPEPGALSGDAKHCAA